MPIAYIAVVARVRPSPARAPARVTSPSAMAVVRLAAARPMVVLLALLALLCGASAAKSAVITIDGQKSLDAALKANDFLVVEYYAPVRPCAARALRRARAWRPCPVGWRSGCHALCTARHAARSSRLRTPRAKHAASRRAHARQIGQRRGAVSRNVQCATHD